MRRSPSPHTPMQETHTLLHNSFCCTIVPIITNLGNICNRVDGSFILAAGKPDRGGGTYVSVMKRGVGSRLRNANDFLHRFLVCLGGELHTGGGDPPSAPWREPARFYAILYVTAASPDGEARQWSHGVRKEENVNLYGTQGDSAADLGAI